MALILCIETSTEVCSVAIAQNGELVDFIEDTSGLNHSRLLTSFINDLLKKNSILVNDLSAIAVSEGPGSYTGLRIGVSVAKGMCYALSIPMISISPLLSMTDAVIRSKKTEAFSFLSTDLLCPTIDARRMEIYTAQYNSELSEIEPVSAKIIDHSSYSEELKTQRVILFGNGAEKLKSTITHHNAVFFDNVITSATNMVKLAHQRFTNSIFVDVAYFEPFYLKNFVATTSKKAFF